MRGVAEWLADGLDHYRGAATAHKVGHQWGRPYTAGLDYRDAFLWLLGDEVVDGISGGVVEVGEDAGITGFPPRSTADTSVGSSGLWDWMERDKGQRLG